MTLKKLRKKLIFVAYKKTQNWQDAEDVAHDALLETFEEFGVNETIFDSNKFNKKVFSNLYKVYYRRLQELSKLRNAVHNMHEGVMSDEIKDQIETGDYGETQLGSRIRIKIR